MNFHNHNKSLQFQILISPSHAVQMERSQRSWTLHMQMAYLNPAVMHLKDPSCKPKSLANNIVVFEYLAMECHTSVEADGDHIEYSNRIYTKVSRGGGAIIRNYDIILPFRCLYKRSHLQTQSVGNGVTKGVYIKTIDKLTVDSKGQ